MADIFTCDNCGQDFPRDQLKEVFLGDGEGEGKKRLELDAECLDKKMNDAPDVYGVEGQEKRRAAYLAANPGDTPAGATGRREQP